MCVSLLGCVLRAVVATRDAASAPNEPGLPLLGDPDQHILRASFPTLDPRTADPRGSTARSTRASPNAKHLTLATYPALARRAPFLRCREPTTCVLPKHDNIAARPHHLNVGEQVWGRKKKVRSQHPGRPIAHRLDRIMASRPVFVTAAILPDRGASSSLLLHSKSHALGSASAHHHQLRHRCSSSSTWKSFVS